METIASVLGNRQVAFLSQDDKARVPIGITAANKQAPFLMSIEYRVALPDHDWVVAERHKLIPSVYAGIVITSGKIDGSPAQVTYSGPTYISIRSGKHSGSSAATHAYDFHHLLTMAEFDCVLHGKFFCYNLHIYLLLKSSIQSSIPYIVAPKSWSH